MYWYKCSFVICIEYDEFLNFINLPKRVFCPATPYWWEYKLVQPGTVGSTVTSTK